MSVPCTDMYVPICIFLSMWSGFQMASICFRIPHPKFLLSNNVLWLVRRAVVAARARALQSFSQGEKLDGEPGEKGSLPR